MTKRIVRSCAVLALSVSAVAAGPARLTAQRTEATRTRAHVEALASERFGGRLTGSEGERLSREYIISELRRIGARPLPGQTDFALPFEFTAGTRDGGSTLRVASGPDVGPNGVRALSFSDNAATTAPVVFAGYGIVVPEAQDFGYDSFAGLDVKDKVVLVLRYFPENADMKTRGILARYSDLRYKAMAARQRGAKALIVVTGPKSPNAGELIAMSFDTALSGSGVIAASISGSVGNAIIESMPGKTLASVQESFDSGNPHVAGFDIPGITVSIDTRVARERQVGHNIAGYLPATTPVGTLPKPWVALGAHYDHLGAGGNGLSLGTKEEAGQVHGGADDNASGTAAVLAAGEILSKQPRRRHVVLQFWSGEELGLLGSSAFVARPALPLADLEAYLNFDMVGRMQDNKLTVQASGTSPVWNRLLEQANVTAGFDLRLQPDPYQPTDVSTFNGVGVPSLNFFTGVHTDYHRPSDTAAKINYEDLDRVIAFASAIARRLTDLDEVPQFTKVEPQTQSGAGRAGIRLFTGTVPDYSSEAKGLLLSGVVGGGPAEQAGLRKGDVIVEIAGQSIANIYDYTYALEVLKVGEPAKVVYVRGGERKETTMTPTARK